MEAESLREVADEAPEGEEDDGGEDEEEHCFRGEGVVPLEAPEDVDAEGLGGDADEEEVGEGEGVVGDEGVLEGGDDGDGGVEGVAEEEVACSYRQQQ